MSGPMAVYFCLSEELSWGGSYEPPEYGSICVIVAAPNRARAKWLALKSDSRHLRDVLAGGMAEMPKFAVRKIGETEGPERILPDANDWWERCPEIKVPR